MANITEKDIIGLKNKAIEIRDTVISAKSTLANVLSNIANYEKELVQLGVDPNAVDDAITSLKDEIEKVYTESMEIINGWNQKMKGAN